MLRRELGGDGGAERFPEVDDARRIDVWTRTEIVERGARVRTKSRLGRRAGVATIPAVVEEKHAMPRAREPARKSGPECAVAAVPVADEHRDAARRRRRRHEPAAQAHAILCQELDVARAGKRARRRRHGPSLGEIEEIALGGPHERDERDDADRRDEDDRDQRARGTQRGTVRRYSRYDAPKRSSSVGSS